MKVFLLRHAHASCGGPDPDRPLSPQGNDIIMKLASFMEGNPFYNFHEIWCSPYLRARQTADPLLSLLKNPQRITYSDILTPGANPGLIHDIVRKAQANLLIVGHNPHLSLLAAALLGAESGISPFSMKKAGLAIFRKEPFNGSGFALTAYLTPSSLGFKV